VAGQDAVVVSVTVPAAPESVAIVRSVVATVAAGLRFSYEAVDELRIAVGEACAYLLRAQPQPKELRVRVDRSPGVISVTVATDVPADGWPPEGAEDSLAWYVLSALADEAEFADESGAGAIRITKHSLATGA
jgi:anti-sigma regulatory factor (Ser/Thr protein kinase)